MEDVVMAEVDTEHIGDTSVTIQSTQSSESLPSFTLQFANKIYSVFSEASPILPSADQQASMQPLFLGQDSLIQSDLANFLDELRTHFSCDSDIKVTFPTLNNISFNNNMIWAQQVHLCDLASMHTTLAGVGTPFHMLIEEEKSSFVNEYNSLIELVEANKLKRVQEPKGDDIAKSELATDDINNEQTIAIEQTNNLTIQQEEAAEEDVLIDEIEPVESSTAGASTTELSHKPADNSLSTSPTESENDEMQVSTVDSPVAGPLIEHANAVEQFRLANPTEATSLTENSLEEERSEHYKQQLANSAISAEGSAADRPNESQHSLAEKDSASSSSLTIVTHKHIEPILKPGTPGLGYEEVNIDDEDGEPSPSSASVAPATSADHSSTAVIVEGGVAIPGHVGVELTSTDGIDRSATPAADRPLPSEMEAHADNWEVETDEVDVDASTPDRRKRTRDEIEINEGAAAGADEEVEVASDIQDFDHVAKRAKLAEVEEEAAAAAT